MIVLSFNGKEALVNNDEKTRKIKRGYFMHVVEKHRNKEQPAWILLVGKRQNTRDSYRQSVQFGLILEIKTLELDI